MTDEEPTPSDPNDRRITRRGLLRGAGAVAAALPLAPTAAGAAPSARAASPHGGATGPNPGTFGRMFPTLPPFAQPSDSVTAALLDIGRPGGLLDAQDDLTAGPVALITDPTLSVVNRDNPTHTAGTTFMGQFLDHDVTFDVASVLGVPTDPTTSPNARTPAFDLDSVYGGGPKYSPELYDPTQATTFRLETGGLFEDLPRRDNGTAIVADPRNDENLVVAGLQCATMLFHNHAVDVVRASGVKKPDDVFRQARQLTTWHYQWLILHEFLPLFVGADLAASVLKVGRIPGFRTVPFIPVEFQAAAYRFGHSMVRPSYRANLAGDNGQPFFGFVFDAAQSASADPDDLSGAHRAPRRFIDWQTFFDFGDGEVKRNKRIDTHISSPLFNLPLSAIASHDAPTVLPQRTLLRQLTWSLPSGQDVARALGVPPLAPGDLAELTQYGLGFETSTPLWYYVLKEAEVVTDGLTLGPAGGRIVALVFLALLLLDPSSYLNSRRPWRPTLPTRTGAVTGDFRMVDFLTFAGVDPASRAG